MDSVRICYFGSPDFSRQLLEEISGYHEIVCVVSNPDSISDRSRIPKPTPVSSLAIEKGWKLLRPADVKDPEFILELQNLKPDAGVVFSYGKILPQELIEIPRYGMMNLHGSLLPDLRGASPLQTAIMKGYKKSGWTLQKVSQKMDAGDILAQVEFSIEEEETTGELLRRVLPLGIRLVLEVLNAPEDYLKKAKPQNEELATYCYKIHQENAEIQWNKHAGEIHNFVRALNPSPVAHTSLRKHNGEIIKPVKIYRTTLKFEEEIKTQLLRLEKKEGEVHIIKQNKRNRLFAKARDSWLEILEIQYPAKKQLPAHDFINGKFLQEGDRFL